MSRYRKIGSILLLILFVAGMWLIQRWTMTPDIIRINNETMTVIDGDSFRSASDEFRLYGVDAPEFHQRCKLQNGDDWACGRQAREKLGELLRGSEHVCEVRARDRFGRAIVSCEDGEGSDLGGAMVASGMALSGQEFDDVIYPKQEAAAKESASGIWQGTFEHPKKWRESNPRQ